METLEDILASFEQHKDKYSAVFDLETGKVISVGPSVCFENLPNKISIDKDLAEEILTANIQIANCYVDKDSAQLEIVEYKSIRKIDDVLHRLPLRKFTNIKNPDLFITYNQKNQTMKFELSKELGGTKKLGFNKNRNIYWSGDTIMTFYLTKYNDPHWILHTFDVKIEELTGKFKIFKNLDIPKKFSLFTRRILKNYVIEIK